MSKPRNIGGFPDIFEGFTKLLPLNTNLLFNKLIQQIITFNRFSDNFIADFMMLDISLHLMLPSQFLFHLLLTLEIPFLCITTFIVASLIDFISFALNISFGASIAEFFTQLKCQLKCEYKA